MSLYSRVKKEVEEGKKGNNIGLDMGLPRLSSFLNGIQKKCYFTVFGAEGTGKSSFAINSFCMAPYHWCQKANFAFDLHVRIYSLEVDEVSLAARLMSWKMFADEGTITSGNQILSKSKDIMITKYIEDKVDSLEEFFNEFEKRVTIIDKPMSPSEIQKDITDFANTRGKFYKDDKGILRYSPHNKNERVIVIVDTLSNLKLENVAGRSDIKGTIDKHSSICRYFYRNVLGYSVVNIAHANRAITDPSRVKYGEIFPDKTDIMYSSVPAFDSEVVLALFNPRDYMNDNNNLNRFMGYKIDEMSDRAIAIGVLKNRYGEKNKRVMTLFMPECSYFRELLPASSMTDEHYTYIKNLKMSDVPRTFER